MLSYTVISHKHLEFVVMNYPADSNATTFANLLSTLRVTHVVRTCENLYDTSCFEGIEFIDLFFSDGSSPPSRIIRKWLAFLCSFSTDSKHTIAVQCLAGLGRAPLLVAIFLVESGVKYNKAISMIRKKRRNALNYPQIEFLRKYKKRGTNCKCSLL